MLKHHKKLKFLWDKCPKKEKGNIVELKKGKDEFLKEFNNIIKTPMENKIKQLEEAVLYLAKNLDGCITCELPIKSILQDTEEPRKWTPEDIKDDLPLSHLAKEWAKGGRSSENIFGVINFLTHFKKEMYVEPIGESTYSQAEVCPECLYKPKNGHRISCSKYEEPTEDSFEEETCPVCGYYCLGKGKIGCIDKPSLVEKHWCMCTELLAVARDMFSTCSKCGGKDAYGASTLRPTEYKKTNLLKGKE